MSFSKIEIRYNLKITVVMTVLVFLGVSLFLSDYISIIRKAMYLVPFIAFSFLLILKNQQISIGTTLSPINVYSLLVIFACSFSLIFGIGQLSLTIYLKEYFFIVSPILSSWFIYRFISSEDLFKANKALILIFLVFNLPNLQYLLGLNIGNFLIHSQSSTESTFAFIYGLLAVYFLIEKKKFWFIVSIILSVIGSKRIVLFATFVAIISYYLIKWFLPFLSKNKTSIIVVVCLLNLAFLYLLIGISIGYFDDFFIEHIGVSPNYLLKGRVHIYSWVIDKIGTVSILPKGLALTSTILQSDSSGETHAALMHSDVLRYYLEFGLIINTLIFVLLYKIGLDSIKALPIIVYYNVLMLTDNITIYFDVMFIFYMYIFFYSKNNKSLQYKKLKMNFN